MKQRAWLTAPLALVWVTACASHDTRTEVSLPTVLPTPNPVTVSNDRPASPPWRGSERFHLRMEQDSVNVPVTNHIVTVARHAFTLVFELRGLDFVRVNASYSPKTLERAASNASLADLDGVFGDGRGAAEEEDPPHGIFVDDESFNYWGWDGDTHRCHAHATRAGVSTCSRIIEMLRRGGDNVMIQKSTTRALYVVVMATEEEHELQRDWMTITFQ